MKEYVSRQITNIFMKHGVEEYTHEYIILIDDDWYTPCEFINEFGLEDSFGPEYVFEEVVQAVKLSISRLKHQGFAPEFGNDDESHNLYLMIEFIKDIKTTKNLKETSIEVFPKNGKLQARAIGQRDASNNYSNFSAKDMLQPLTQQQLSTTKAIISDLKSRNKLQDISQEFDLNPQADITFMGNGDAVITPDGNNKQSYRLPAAEIDKFANTVKESITKDDLFEYILQEDINDFPKSTRPMYRYAKRRHDDTRAIRKVSKEPYWVHPEGVAKIVMENDGSDIEIKAAMAHDTMEDTGATFEDIAEKFGFRIASIVKELTNDKNKIAIMGKENYMSEKLCGLSDEALTVKLADMLYNQKDFPTEINYIRTRNNVNYLLDNRKDLSNIHKKLIQEILNE